MHFKEEVIGPITDDNDVEASDCEDTDEDLTIIPTTDIPEVILVEEDEFTEKINESTEIFDNIKQVQLSLDEAVKENKVSVVVICLDTKAGELAKSRLDCSRVILWDQYVECQDLEQFMFASLAWSVSTMKYAS